MNSNRILKPDWPQLPSRFDALVTLRTGGVSPAPYGDATGGNGFNLADHVGDQIENVLHNRALLDELLPTQPQWLQQVHGINVFNFDRKLHSKGADACITTRPKIVCAVLTADCLPILLCDATCGVVAAVHAGWRGLADGVIENTIATMKSAGAKSEQMLAWLGPAIGPSHFEVGEEVRDRFIRQDQHATTAFAASGQQGSKFFADIFQLAKMRLERMGVCDIAGGQHCTFSMPEKFYSYRRDGVTGRMASLIWIK